jgi:prophage regulatory protein
MNDRSEQLIKISRPWYLTRKQVVQITGLSRDTIDRLEKKGLFPRRIPLSARRICWDLQEVEAWDLERKNSRR